MKPYKSLKTLATVSIAALCLTIVCSIAHFWTTSEVYDRLVSARAISKEQTDFVDKFDQPVANVQWGITIIAGISFLFWFKQSRDNLEALGVTDVKTSADWTIWGFIIPVMALFKPMTVAQEIFKASKPSIDSNWRKHRSSLLIWTWWIFWLVYCGYGRSLDLYAKAIQGKATLENLSTLYGSFPLCEALSIAAASLAISVVWKITSLQDRKHYSMAVGGKADELTATMKICPFCGESIKAAAILCRYCRNDLKANLPTTSAMQTALTVSEVPVQECSLDDEVKSSDSANHDRSSDEISDLPISRELKNQMAILQSLIAICVPIIGIFNFAGAIVGGIWLAILGEWGVIGTGLAALVGGSWLLGCALMPGLLFAPLAIAAEQSKNKILLYCSGLLSFGYTYVVAIVWIVGVFSYFVKATESDALIPACLWAYSTASTPWVYMMSKEQDNISTVIGAFFIQVVSVILVFGFTLLHFNYSSAALTCASIFLLLTLFQARFAQLLLAAEDHHRNV